MRTRLLGGRSVSVIVLGTALFGEPCTEAQSFEVMDAYVRIGGNFIDNARLYARGESERIVGRWMAARGNRESIFLCTKGAHPPVEDMRHSRLSREEVRGDMARSLDALGTDHVDLYFLHRDDESRPVGDIMETLQSLLDDGFTRMTGVSNWSPKRIREANEYARTHGLAPLSANQPRFSLAEQITVEDPTLRAMDRETWQMHRDENLPCLCFTSMAKGFFTKLDSLGPDGLSEKAKTRYWSEENLAIFDRLKVLSHETGYSVNALSLAYLTCQPFPTFPIVGTSSIEHVAALQEAGDAVLTDEQRDTLRTY